MQRYGATGCRLYVKSHTIWYDITYIPDTELQAALSGRMVRYLFSLVRREARTAEWLSAPLSVFDGFSLYSLKYAREYREKLSNEIHYFSLFRWIHPKNRKFQKGFTNFQHPRTRCRGPPPEGLKIPCFSNLRRCQDTQNLFIKKISNEF